MITSLQEVDAIIADLVDNAMFLRQTPGPCACGKVLKWFGFADAAEWIAQDGFDQVEGAQRNLSIRFHTMAQVFAELWVKNHVALR